MNQNQTTLLQQNGWTEGRQNLWSKADANGYLHFIDLRYGRKRAYKQVAGGGLEDEDNPIILSLCGMENGQQALF